MQHLQKTGGGVSNFPARLPLSRRLPRLAFRPIPIPYPLSPFLSYSCRALLHNGTSTTHFYSIGYTHFPSRRRVYPIEASWLSPRKATGRAVHSARFLTSLPPYFLTSRGAHRAPLAFRPIPPSRSRGTINIAGSKLALVTAKCPSTSSPQALPSTPSKSIRLSSPACATSQNYSPISPSSPATFSKPTSPPSLPTAASASTAIFPTTSPRRFFITCSLSPASSTKYTSSFRPKSRFASPRNRARAIMAIFPSSRSSTRAPNSSSKSLATLSTRRRKSLPPSSRSACPVSAQSSPSAAHLTSWIL